MELTNLEKEYIHNLFYDDGYVLSNQAFSDHTFGKFTMNSIDENIKTKYGLSKGKSLDAYFNDDSVEINKKLKLLKELIRYAEEIFAEKEMRRRENFGYNSNEPVLNPKALQRCKEILDSRAGIRMVVESEIIQEKGLKELVEEAQEYFKQDKKVACEKIWDAFERLKTYYSPQLDKKTSANKIVEDMSHLDTNYITLFEEEFLKLTKIGNDYRIRHHETTKIEIIDHKYYEYFYHRCLTLIDLAIGYLK